MADFLVILKQKCEGCDSTIGCGIALKTVQAESTAEAVDALQVEWLSEDSYYLDTTDECEVIAAWIVPACDALALPIENWKRKFARVRSDELEVRAKADRRQEYEKLKREFGE